MQDASLAAAIVDRLLHHGDVFYLKGPSWRLKGRTPDDLPSAPTTTLTMNPNHTKNTTIPSATPA